MYIVKNKVFLETEAIVFVVVFDLLMDHVN